MTFLREEGVRQGVIEGPDCLWNLMEPGGHYLDTSAPSTRWQRENKLWEGLASILVALLRQHL